MTKQQKIEYYEAIKQALVRKYSIDQIAALLQNQGGVDETQVNDLIATYLTENPQAGEGINIDVTSSPVRNYLDDTTINQMVTQQVQVALANLEPRTLIQTEYQWNITTPSITGIWQVDNTTNMAYNFYNLCYAELDNLLIIGDNASYKIYFLDAETKEEKYPSINTANDRIASTPDGKRIVVVTSITSIKVYNRENGVYVDKGEYATSSTTYNIAINQTGDLITTVDHIGYFRFLRLNGSGTFDYISKDVVRLGEYKVRLSFVSPTELFAISIGNNYLRKYTIADDNSITSDSTMSLDNWSPLADYAGSDEFGSLALSADRQIIYIGKYTDDAVSDNNGKIHIYVLDDDGVTYKYLESLSPTNTISGEYFGVSLGVSFDGSKIYTNGKLSKTIYEFKQEIQTTTLDAYSTDPFGDGSLVRLQTLETSSAETLSNTTVTEYGSPTFDGSKMLLDGNGSYLVDENISFTEPFSLNVKLSTSDKTKSYVRAIGIGSYSDGSDNFMEFGFTYNDIQKMYFKCTGAGLTNNHYTTTLDVVDNQEYTVCFSYNGSDNLKVYVDGAEIASWVTTLTSTNRPIHLGSGVPNVTATQTLNGSISVAQLFDRALTQEEVTELYNATYTQSNEQYIIYDLASSNEQWVASNNGVSVVTYIDNNLQVSRSGVVDTDVLASIPVGTPVLSNPATYRLTYEIDLDNSTFVSGGSTSYIMFSDTGDVNNTIRLDINENTASGSIEKSLTKLDQGYIVLNYDSKILFTSIKLERIA